MDETVDLERLFFPERKNQSTGCNHAEKAGVNSHKTHLIAIPASQRGHTRSESFCPSRYVSRLLKGMVRVIRIGST